MVRHLCSANILFVVLVLWTVSLLPGCSGTRSYQSAADNNLHVQTTTDSGSWFSGVRVAMDIHGLGQDCRANYEGTVQLSQPTINVGIPPNRWTQLVFVFESSTFLANRRGTITYDTLLKPRAGYQYQIAVSYKNDIYHVTIRETPPNQSAGLEMERHPLSACRLASTRK